MTDSERIARGIAYLRDELQKDAAAREWRLIGGVATVNTRWANDLSEALALMQSARDEPNAIDRITTVARLYVLSDDRDRWFVWAKVLAHMGLSNPRDGAPSTE
jgi:cytochrome c-type biogenesis protein CcmH/NrfG